MKVLRYVLHLSAIFALAGIGTLTLELCKVAHQLTITEQATTRSLNEVHDLAADVHENLTRKGGILDIAKATMLHVDRVTGEAAIAVRQQRTYWDTAGKETVASLGHLNLAIATLDTTIAGVGTDVHNTSNAVNGVLGETKTAVSSLNNVIADPQIPALLKSAAETVQNINKTSASIAGMATTMNAKVSELAHPSKSQRILNYVTDAMRASSYLAWLYK